jgi:hypothetical protein
MRQFAHGHGAPLSSLEEWMQRKSMPGSGSANDLAQIEQLRPREYAIATCITGSGHEPNG